MGQPGRSDSVILQKKHTKGTETSKYLEEEKTNSDSLSSGERTGKSPNLLCYGTEGVVGPTFSLVKQLKRLGKVDQRG